MRCSGGAGGERPGPEGVGSSGAEGEALALHQPSWGSPPEGGSELRLLGWALAALSHPPFPTQDNCSLLRQVSQNMC